MLLHKFSGVSLQHGSKSFSEKFLTARVHLFDEIRTFFERNCWRAKRVHRNSREFAESQILVRLFDEIRTFFERN
jgi:hypothetical protein